MNCDDAFDCLTDPRSSRRGELARHLQACPRCREMADTLSPALAGLENAGLENAWLENDEAACCHGAADRDAAQLMPKSSSPQFLSPQVLLIAEQSAAALNRRARMRQSARWAVAIVMVLACGVWGSLWQLPEADAPSQQAALSDSHVEAGCLWLLSGFKPAESIQLATNDT